MIAANARARFAFLRRALETRMAGGVQMIFPDTLCSNHC
jgi:hypothetical protein